MTRPLSPGPLLLAVALSLSAPQALGDSDAIAEQQAQLDALAQKIQRQQAQLTQAQVEKDKQQQALRNAEKSVSASAAAVRQSQQALQAAEAELQRLDREQKSLEDQLKRQQDRLAAQLRTAWMSGSADHTALLLGNEDPARLERMLVYYQYLNQARIDAIEALAQTRSALTALQQQQQQNRDRQAQLHLEAKERQTELAEHQRRRQRALQDLEQQLKRDQGALANLQENRDVLSAAIRQAQEALEQSQRHQGLSKSRGTLPWPLQARISHAFGAPRQGQLRWNGWLLAADSGREVAAIAPGQVVFADWLRGFGLVLVVDHGDQYLSLYGHAQALLKQVGELVRGGEVIALSGDSGGLDRPGLYFEVRHRGRAVDPMLYLRKRGS